MNKLLVFATSSAGAFSKLVGCASCATVGFEKSAKGIKAATISAKVFFMKGSGELGVVRSFRGTSVEVIGPSDAVELLPKRSWVLSGDASLA